MFNNYIILILVFIVFISITIYVLYFRKKSNGSEKNDKLENIQSNNYSKEKEMKEKNKLYNGLKKKYMTLY